MTVPIGSSLFGVFAQAVHQDVLKRHVMQKDLSIRDVVEVRLYRYGSYIDDSFSLGTHESIARRKLDSVVAKCKELGIATKEGKLECTEITTLTIIGFGFTLKV